MRARVISTYDDLRGLLGEDLGPGGWSNISEERARLFQAACSDGPFVARIDADRPTPRMVDAGLLISLLGPLRASIEGLCFDFASRMNVFYGFDSVRIFEPLLLPAIIRLHLRIVEAKLLDPGIVHVVYRNRLETSDGVTALTADVINRIYLK